MSRLADRMRETKLCEQCKTTIHRRIDEGAANWGRRKFCSTKCSDIAHGRKRRKTRGIDHKPMRAHYPVPGTYAIGAWLDEFLYRHPANARPASVYWQT